MVMVTIKIKKMIMMLPIADQSCCGVCSPTGVGGPLAHSGLCLRPDHSRRLRPGAALQLVIMFPEWCQMFSEWCQMFLELCQMFLEWRQMFPEWRQMFPEWRQMFPEWCQMFPEWCQMFPEWRQMFPEWCQMFSATHLCAACV